MPTVERAGWMAKHPLNGDRVEVVTAAWFFETVDEANRLLDKAGVPRLTAATTKSEELLERLKLLPQKGK